MYIYMHIYLCIAYISSHSKGPEQDLLRKPFVPYVRNTAERSIHSFDSGPYIYTVYIYIHCICIYIYIQLQHASLVRVLCVNWSTHAENRNTTQTSNWRPNSVWSGTPKPLTIHQYIIVKFDLLEAQNDNFYVMVLHWISISKRYMIGVCVCVPMTIFCLYTILPYIYIYIHKLHITFKYTES